ncbi:protein of unknown function [Luteibacter sp. UNCMF331Sha3.1]|uniref:DUF4381 domain-containing protein n=1 Tax=Luteibacter sp. UNCMF331Sha3.1 TaxID=1502760 RepID=UPI0008B20D96|nr:DUF4381 domain-containing protein [Luteibacter sp. UNCMF331Sha3.1]SEM40748.1 protein of unknown function [Luteibacter sp. UNCMF331Sha3.1]
MPPNGPELRDIHVPYVSPWWPLAPGWWLLLGLLALVAIVVVIVVRRRRAWHRYLDASLRGLRDATARHASDGDARAFAATASDLVRRVARTRDPHSVALSGEAWRDALAAMSPKHDVDAIAAIDAMKYRRDIDIDVPGTARDVETWVRVALRRPTVGRRTHVAS